MKSKDGMKSKKVIWYLGYVVALGIVLLIVLTDFPNVVDIALCFTFAVVFAVSHVNLFQEKMLKTDKDYKINVMDERNIAIKEKAGNAANMINTLLLGAATMIFIAMNYSVPAVILGVVVLIQPVILLVVSQVIEKKM